MSSYQGKIKFRNGVDLEQRTAEIKRLALAGIYHYEIAKRLHVSRSTLALTTRMLRKTGQLPAQRGPRAKVASINWKAAENIWDDLNIQLDQAVVQIGCSKRTIYRRLGPRKLRRTPVTAVQQPAAVPSKQDKGWSMSFMRGPDPFRELRLQRSAEAGRGRV